jgi:NADH-quinone oxidoreductase subunit A
MRGPYAATELHGVVKMQTSAVLPLLLFLVCVSGLAAVLLAMAAWLNPKRPGAVKRMPYESGMDPVHDTRRRFDVRFHLMAIAFLVYDVELLFLYPWAVAMRPASQAGAGPSELAPQTAAAAAGVVPEGSRDMVFAGAMVFLALLAVGFVYDWRKGVFRWR